MEIKQIKELMVAMGRSGIKKLSFKKEGIELQLEAEEQFSAGQEEDLSDSTGEPFYRRGLEKRTDRALARGQELSAPLAHPPPSVPVEASKHQHFITSPMVGTFYTGAAPDEPAFIKVGDKVNKDTVVGIIEAMKVMNEIKALIVGTVVEILVENGHPVEFGSKLFCVEQNH